MSNPGRESVIIDPLWVFLQAIFFDYTTRVLSQLANAHLSARPVTPPTKSGVVTGEIRSRAEVPPTLIPLGVNAVFCVELLLKSILIQQNNGSLPKRIHTLSELFGALHEPARIKIENQFKIFFERDVVGVHRREDSPDRASFDFLPMLTKHDRAFQDVRYCYEATGDWEFETLEPIRLALIDYALEVNPSWQSELEKIEPLPTLLRR